MKTLAALAALTLALAGSAADAQSLDLGASHIVPLPSADAGSELVTKQLQLQPVITRAWAREDASGALEVECRVEASPFVAAATDAPPRRNAELRP